MKQQNDQHRQSNSNWYTVMLLLFGFLLQVNYTFAATDSLLYAGALPVPGTNTVSNYLTLIQSGTLIENDRATLKWQSDGNLVLYYRYRFQQLWASNTGGKGTTLSFDKDEGKLSILNSRGEVIWSADGTAASILQLTWDCNLILFNNHNSQIWESGSGKSHLKDNGALHTIKFYKSIQDFVVPLNPPYKYLYVRAEGADGGKKEVKEIDGSIRFRVAGGSGATIIGVFEIGTGPDMIPPGSTLHFVVGERGDTRIGGTTAGCEGGGGTGVLLRKPNDSYFHLLLIAGGGGGAYSDCCGVRRKGRSAVTEEDGGKGGGDKYHGGTNGGDGDGSGFGGQFGGYGINADGWANKKTLYGPKDYVVTGWPSRGWVGEERYGLSGGASQGVGGGGGGGFSGGGSGKWYYPGGGGGSFVNTYFAKFEIRKKNGATTDTQDGFVNYRFSNAVSMPISLEKYTNKCLDDYRSETANGTNIQLYPCNGGTAQAWTFMDGLTFKLGTQSNKCMDLTQSDPTEGTNIQLFNCNGTKAQVWVYDGITRNIRSGVDMSKCLHAGDGAGAGASNITLWACKTVDNMRWTIDGATLPVISTQNRIVYADDTDRCIDLKESQTENGTNIQLWNCNNSDAQYWYFVDNTIRWKDKDSGKCIDLDQSNIDNGTNIQLWKCNDSDAQRWTYNANTQSFHSWVEPTKCIDLYYGRTANGTNIQLHDCNGTNPQKFLITE